MCKKVYLFRFTWIVYGVLGKRVARAQKKEKYVEKKREREKSKDIGIKEIDQ